MNLRKKNNENYARYNIIFTKQLIVEVCCTNTNFKCIWPYNNKYVFFLILSSKTKIQQVSYFYFCIIL